MTGWQRRRRRTTAEGRGAVSRGSFLRRAGVLAAGAVGVAAVEGATAGSAAANDGDKLILGYYGNTAQSPTGLAFTGSNPGYGFAVTDQGLNSFPVKGALAGHTKNGFDAGVFGYSEGPYQGIWGKSELGLGIFGEGRLCGIRGHANLADPSVVGVEGSSDAGVGVNGIGAAVGVRGWMNYGNSGDAVLGHHEGSAGHAIHGQCLNGANSDAAVYGESAGQEAPAVQGVKTSGGGYAVFGLIDDPSNTHAATAGLTNGSGAGVYGVAYGSGPGVLAQNNDPSKAALLVGPGRLDVSRSGIVSIAYPNNSATVSVPGGLTSAALALATVQNNVGVYVKAATPNMGAGTIQVLLNKAPASGKTAHVGWLVVN